MYEWLKVLHVLAIISWMAALLYLPRLMVYHVEAPVGSQQSETFKVMERKLLNGIMTPAMIVSWVVGLYLAYAGFGFKGGWLHAKIALVLLMSGMHGFLIGRVRDFANDRNSRSGRFYRVINEVPAVLMVGIVILVIVKPF
ncbi:MAG: protoporphyrinogen oxidase HemJ [Bosea sp. (in: a-proteobacteria)]